MEALYYAIFYSICTTAWLAAFGLAIQVIEYTVFTDNTDKSNYKLIAQFRYSRFFLVCMISGASIGLTVLAVSNGLSGDLVFAQLFILSMTACIYKLWVSAPPTEDEYINALSYAYRVHAKQATIQSVLGIIGGMQTNATDGDGGGPYRSSGDVLDYLVSHFKSELEKVDGSSL